LEREQSLEDFAQVLRATAKELEFIANSFFAPAKAYQNRVLLQVSAVQLLKNGTGWTNEAVDDEEFEDAREVIPFCVEYPWQQERERRRFLDFQSCSE
jgi:hypothetical protein